MNKKLLIISYACEPNKGSEEGVGWNFPFYLALKGENVSVITRSIGRSAIEKEMKKYPNLQLKFHYVDLPGRSNISNLPSGSVYLDSIFWQLKALGYSKENLQDIELVHHVTWSGIFIGSLFWKLGKPFVFGPCGGGQVVSPKYSSCFGSNWAKESIRNFATRTYPFSSPTGAFPKHSDLVLVTNSETALLVNKAGAQRLEYFLDSGLPDDFFPMAFPQREMCNKLRVLWVGSLIPRKGLSLALKVLKKCDFPIELTIAGDGPQRLQLLGLIKQLQLEDKVKFLGKVLWSELKVIYANNDVFLFTSIRDSFGGQVLEAMAYGLPVIAMNQSGIKTFVPDNASVKVACDDPEKTILEMGEALRALWVNKDLREAMGKAAYLFASSQVWSKRIDKILQFYNNLL